MPLRIAFCELDPRFTFVVIREKLMTLGALTLIAIVAVSDTVVTWNIWWFFIRRSTVQFRIMFTCFDRFHFRCSFSAFWLIDWWYYYLNFAGDCISVLFYREPLKRAAEPLHLPLWDVESTGSLMLSTITMSLGETKRPWLILSSFLVASCPLALERKSDCVKVPGL